MKIISGFRDYYDVGLSNGFDDSRVYVRKTERLNEVDDNRRYAALVKGLLTVVPAYRSQVKERLFEFFLVVLGGRAYPGVKVVTLDKPGSEYWYDCDRIRDALEDLQPIGMGMFFKKEYTASVEGFLALDGSDRFMEDVVALRLPLVYADWRPGAPFVTKDPVLKPLQFGKRLDACSAFQELSMFLGGVLAPENRPTVAISDRDRIVQHGFDHHSFRKAKENTA